MEQEGFKMDDLVQEIRDFINDLEVISDLLEDEKKLDEIIEKTRTLKSKISIIQGTSNE